MALGLCCLIVREEGEGSVGRKQGLNLNLSGGMVGGSLGLFLSQVRAGAGTEEKGKAKGEGGRKVNEGIKLVCLSVVFDLLVCCLEGAGGVDERVSFLILNLASAMPRLKLTLTE